MSYQTPLISVIVPIYNVEPYIKNCLNSLKNQSLKQIEIIMIDDGSTDNSGIIAEQYVSTTFPIFRCIHTKNHGLSAARNLGINISCGQWLMFVDSDDWVDKQFCEIPLKIANETNADLVIFQADDIKHNKIKKNNIEISYDFWGLVNEFKAHEYGRRVVWNKLYKKSLFKLIRYPEGRVYEDIAVTHKVVHEANRIILIKDCLYHHVYRGNSIEHLDLLNYKRDSFISNVVRYKDLKSWGYNKNDIYISIITSAIDFLSASDESDSELYVYAKNIIDSVKKVPRGLARSHIVLLFFWKKSKRLFYFISKIIRIIKRYF